MTNIRNLRAARGQRGAALVEYGLLISGVALITAAGVSIFGHKTNDLVASVASILPGAHGDDNGPIFSGKIIETTGVEGTESPPIAVDVTTIVGNSGTGRLGNNLLGPGGGDLLEDLVIEPGE